MMTIEQLGDFAINTNKAAISKYGKEHQLFVCIEELSELQKELTKAGRNIGNKSGLYEEFADTVIIMLQIAMIFDLDENEIMREMARKLDRTNRRMAEDR